MISKELELTLEATVRDAKARNHEYLTVEHILFALLHDEWGVQIVTHCGGSVSRLKSSLEKYFDKDVPKLQKDAGGYPQPTVGFHRVLQGALNHVKSAGIEEADAGDVLASVLLEKDSHAVHFLASEGITRLDVLNYISHGASDGTEESISGMGEEAEVLHEKEQAQT
ncbi:MAG TPA: Clp protease N-terminal domain-containing protein, partial [Thermodesulfovibrionales bacterium]|nr:Clp protease N-terminal domain-containing protein [Thermodesulfovibrionales bacterium]